jgi:hypothetical protein
MSERIPLDALIRRVSRMAEQMFDKQGDIDLIWLVETVSGEQQIIVSPVIAPSALSAGDYKDKLAAKMRETFADLDVVRYAHAMECWTVDAEMTEEQFALHYAALGYTLANHPNRREVVLCEAEDGTEVLTAVRDIVRPAHGKPYLGKLGAIERRRGLYGRWIGLLPSKEHAEALQERPQQDSTLPRIRNSNELPDDVGRMFVTAVPNAPIQLLGRRDPETGELCVGWALGPPRKDIPAPSGDDLPSYIEVVTGPEAERFILAVHRQLTERANQEGLTVEEFMAKYFEREQEPKP